MNNTFSIISSRLYALLTAGMVLLALPGLCMAANSPSVKAAGDKQPAPEKIRIKSDYMKMNLNTGVSVYTGNVKIEQGDLVLTGDRVTLKQQKNEIEKITVDGNPARYHHVTKNGESVMAQSQKMVYIAAENRLIMTENASLEQPDHKVSSQKIVYDTLNRIVMAGEASDSNAPNEQQRVNITLTPKSSSEQSKTTPTGNK